MEWWNIGMLFLGGSFSSINFSVKKGFEEHDWQALRPDFAKSGFELPMRF
jgi:hypothetical protein